MIFWITKKPEVALLLIPWFICDDDPRLDMYLELRQRLTDNPDDTFVCVVIADDLIKGMTIAYCRDKDVFIWQASTDRTVPRSIVDIALNGIKYWAKAKGFNRIAGGMLRNRKIWVRRFGFEESQENKNEVYMEI